MPGARCDRRTDIVFRERLAAWANYAGGLLQTAARKWDVCGDHDVVRLHVFNNPIIGRVESALYNSERNPLFIGNSHPRVSHQGDIKAISACDAVHLLFDRARIGIYKDVQQANILTFSGAGNF